MAEIHVQPKKNTTSPWVWILVAVVILAAVAFVLIRKNKQNNTANPPSSSSYLQLPQPAEPAYYL